MYTAVAPASWYTGRSRALWAHGMVSQAVQGGVEWLHGGPTSPMLVLRPQRLLRSLSLGCRARVFFFWAQDEPEPPGFSGVELGSQSGTGTTPSRDP